MREAGMDVLVNPFGTLYNPASIALAVSRLDSDDSYTEADCVQMGAGAGCRTCGVSYGNQTETQLRTASPDYIAGSFAGLLEIV